MENYMINGYDSSINNGLRKPILVDGHIEIYKGDLLRDANVDVICHQTNCMKKMGRGIALTIKRMYPSVYQRYVQYCNEMFFKNRLTGPLGTCQILDVDGRGVKFVANIFGQFTYGTKRQQTMYDSLRSALNQLISDENLVKNKLTLGFPYYMSCALAGGDWDGMVYPMLKEITLNYPGKVEIWKLN